MAVKIKLQRLGKIRAPYYRVVVADARTRRDGRAIETIGKYHPKEQPSLIEVNSDRAQYWLGVGAQPTEPVQQILQITGDWQKFKGLPGAEGKLRTPEPRPSKEERFNQALAEIDGGASAGRTGRASESPSRPSGGSGSSGRNRSPASSEQPAGEQPAGEQPAGEGSAAESASSEAASTGEGERA